MSAPVEVGMGSALHASEIDARAVHVVLVCGDCERRSDGPKHIDAKHLRKHLKHSARGLQARIVVSSCLGPCPKKALTVAVAPTRRGLAMAAVGDADEAAAVVTALLAR